jgi:hypothetical protein
MAGKRNTMTRKKGAGKNNRTRSSKKWLTAIEAAQSTFKKTGSLSQAKRALKLQALTNARRMFGSVGKRL